MKAALPPPRFAFSTQLLADTVDDLVARPLRALCAERFAPRDGASVTLEALIMFFSSPTVAAYGKLPFYEDFLQVRCFSGAVGELRSWVDKGHALAASDDDELAWGGPTGLLFLDSSGRRVVAGVVRDSRDREVGRRFPFVLATELRRRKLPARASERVLAVEPILSDLARATEALALSEGVAPFKASVEGLAVPALGSGDHAADDVDAEALLEPLGGRDCLADALWRVRVAAKSTATFSGADDLRPVLSLPMVRSLPPFQQAWAWLRLLESSGALGDTASASLAFPVNQRDGHLRIALRTPLAKDYVEFCRLSPELLSYDPRAGDESGDLGEFTRDFADKVTGQLHSTPLTLSALAHLDID